MIEESSPVMPTCEELFDIDPTLFTMVERQVDPSWRHGVYMSDVYRRLSDDTYWCAEYRKSTDGETHELRDGIAAIEQVFPRQITKTEYVRCKS
jgi:hypothetical protein